MLYLAMNKQAPSTLKENTSGWEAAGRFFWGYMNTDRFTKFVVPDATMVGFSQSKKQASSTSLTAHVRIGKQLRNLGGCRRDRCGVSAHHAYSGTSRSAPWSNRLLIGGRMRQVMAPLAAGVQERQPQLLSLEAFGEKLSAGMVCAVRVVRDDLWMEGPYWLIKLCG